MLEQRRSSDFAWPRVVAFLDFIDRRQVIRRFVFIWMIIITSEAIHFTFNFAWNSTRPGIDVAAIIAAVWAPLTILQGAVFRFYDETRKKQDA